MVRPKEQPCHAIAAGWVFAESLGRLAQQARRRSRTDPALEAERVAEEDDRSRVVERRRPRSKARAYACSKRTPYAVGVVLGAASRLADVAASWLCLLASVRNARIRRVSVERG